MPRRHRPEPLSPRAAARLRAPRRGYVPTARELTPTTRWPPEDGRARPTPDLDDERGPVPMEVPDLMAERRGVAGADWMDAADVGVRHRPLAEESTSPLPAVEVNRGRTGPRAWFRVPTSFVAARWEPGRLAVIGLGIAVALAVALFGLRVAWASGDGTVLAPGGGSRAGPTGISAGSAPVGATPSVTAGAGVPPSTGAGAATGAGAGAGVVVVVHVVGQVRRPGLQRLPPGSRVADALEAAGGATRKADLARVNLARVLVDGEQVVVPAPGDPDPPGAPATGGGGATAGSGAGSPVSLNTADLAGLDTLPGVGPVLAQRILDWRSEHGRFTSVDELGEVSGIGEKLMERLRPLVTL